MIAPSASKALPGMVHVPDDELSMPELTTHKMTMSSHKNGIILTNAIKYKGQERWTKQSNWHNEVKKLEENLKTEWRENLSRIGEYSA